MNGGPYQAERDYGDLLLGSSPSVSDFVADVPDRRDAAAAAAPAAAEAVPAGRHRRHVPRRNGDQLRVLSRPPASGRCSPQLLAAGEPSGAPPDDILDYDALRLDADISTFSAGSSSRSPQDCVHFLNPSAAARQMSLRVVHAQQQQQHLGQRKPLSRSTTLPVGQVKARVGHANDDKKFSDEGPAATSAAAARPLHVRHHSTGYLPSSTAATSEGIHHKPSVVKRAFESMFRRKNTKRFGEGAAAASSTATATATS